MIRRDVLTRRRDDADKINREAAGHRTTDLNIELDPADHEEPTWEVRRNPTGPRRRLDGRTKLILSIAAIAAVVVNAGAAWTYWQVNNSAAGQVAAGGVISIALRAHSDVNQPLQPRKTGNLTVTVTNDYDHPIRITSVVPGIGRIVADPEHRAAGCADNPVSITEPLFPVQWEVQRNTIGAFIVANGLIMRGDADPACRGATFTVPLRAIGTRRAEP
jgi:hypothetical protein